MSLMSATPFATHHKKWAVINCGEEPPPGQGALCGKQYQPFELAEFNYNAGFRDLDLFTMTAVDLSESQGYDHAIHVNFDMTRDRGIKQISSQHTSVSDEDAYDPQTAADIAYGFVQARKRAGQKGFEDWVGYTSTIYLRDSYVGKAVRGVANFYGNLLLALPVKPVTEDTPYEHRFKQPILNFEHRVAGATHWLQQGKADLGFGAKSKEVVQHVQEDLSKGLTAAKVSLPQS